MRFLFVMDPLGSCDLQWDNSLYLLSELTRRGHHTWTADVSDLWFEERDLYAKAQNIVPSQLSSFPGCDYSKFHAVSLKRLKLDSFDLILIRKDPPFDAAYLNLTYLLERIADKIPVVNHPQGIRDTNEKLSILSFPQWIPQTHVSCSTENILDFRKKLKGAMILKPLDNKGGKGVLKIQRHGKNVRALLNQATAHGRKTLMAQAFIANQSLGEKRVVLLDGKILAAYEKRSIGKEFRANLGLGGTFHPTRLTPLESRLAKSLEPFLIRRGIQFAGIDILEGKLLEINVTSPAGVSEAAFLYQTSKFVGAWADSLERRVLHSRRRLSAQQV